ncbi:MAG TPA: hypothetical protein VGO67_01475 [Verrucomicrobiae bacterium]|jgi:hypothetical protein
MTAEEKEKRSRQRFCDDAGFIVIPADGSAPYHLEGTPLSESDKVLVQETRETMERHEKPSRS